MEEAMASLALAEDQLARQLVAEAAAGAAAALPSLRGSEQLGRGYACLIQADFQRDRLTDLQGTLERCGHAIEDLPVTVVLLWGVVALELQQAEAARGALAAFLSRPAGALALGREDAMALSRLFAVQLLAGACHDFGAAAAWLQGGGAGLSPEQQELLLLEVEEAEELLQEERLAEWAATQAVEAAAAGGADDAAPLQLPLLAAGAADPAPLPAGGDHLGPSASMVSCGESLASADAFGADNTCCAEAAAEMPPPAAAQGAADASAAAGPAAEAAAAAESATEADAAAAAEAAAAAAAVELSAGGGAGDEPPDDDNPFCTMTGLVGAEQRGAGAPCTLTPAPAVGAAHGVPSDGGAAAAQRPPRLEPSSSGGGGGSDSSGKSRGRDQAGGGSKALRTPPLSPAAGAQAPPSPSAGARAAALAGCSGVPPAAEQQQQQQPSQSLLERASSTASGWWSSPAVQSALSALGLQGVPPWELAGGGAVAALVAYCAWRERRTLRRGAAEAAAALAATAQMALGLTFNPMAAAPGSAYSLAR